MKKLLAALLALAALTGAGRAGADPLRYGVADDWPKFHPCGDVWWQSATDIGYQDFRMTVQWNETTPTEIPYQANIQAAIDCAKLTNLRPILAIYPQHPAAIGANAAAQAQFATFVSLVGQTFPDVRDIIVGNEPNVNRFWQPQYRGGVDAAATDYEHTLAQSYDALKTVRPDSIVWGPAISSRGNDNANAASNPSHSPVWFIKYLGDAYKASGRTTPIFDEFDMHPYPPIQDADPFSKPFQWPQAGAANLDRIKQALWDAFNGTAQPLPAEQAIGQGSRSAPAGTALPINLDEAGEQTVVTGHEAAYTDAPENVIPITEQQQSDSHVQLAEIAACDPDVKALLYFPLIDDTSLSGGFQSGNLFADFAHKLSYGGVQAKIAAAKGLCQGGVAGIGQGWRHTHLGARRPGHLRRPRDVARLASGLQAREHTGPLDELHGHRERELCGAARQGPGRCRRCAADGDRQGVLQAGPAVREPAAPPRNVPLPDRPHGADQSGPHDDSDLPDLQDRHAGQAGPRSEPRPARAAALQGPRAREARLRPALSSPLTRRTGVR